MAVWIIFLLFFIPTKSLMLKILLNESNALMQTESYKKGKWIFKIAINYNTNVNTPF
jgi:hypothetical protein